MPIDLLSISGSFYRPQVLNPPFSFPISYCQVSLQTVEQKGAGHGGPLPLELLRLIESIFEDRQVKS